MKRAQKNLTQNVFLPSQAQDDSRILRRSDSDFCFTEIFYYTSKTPPPQKEKKPSILQFNFAQEHKHNYHGQQWSDNETPCLHAASTCLSIHKPSLVWRCCKSKSVVRNTTNGRRPDVVPGCTSHGLFDSRRKFGKVEPGICRVFPRP